MLNWAIAFFLFTVVATIFGLSGLAGVSVEIAKFLALIFVVLFFVSLIYSIITGHRRNVPLP